MSKITSEHLRRQAVVYVRQSTLDQVQNNLESQRRQYALAERARTLGWQEVAVIDDDLGRSGGGVHRPGFERLLALLCEGNTGAVFCIEASRLARNGRDWHTLLEFCRLVDALIIDEDGVYDARQTNDRLLLGMKGTLSEMELSTLRQRSVEALMQKARRGELPMTVAIGYVRAPNDRLEMDPDRRIRKAIELVFRKFRQFGSVRQVLLWLRQERIELPAIVYGAAGRAVIWKLPIYNVVRHILSNPIYAGAYVFGRTKTVTRIEQGRKHSVGGLRQEQWQVLINFRCSIPPEPGQYSMSVHNGAAERLNERDIASPMGGRWCGITVRAMASRLGLPVPPPVRASGHVLAACARRVLTEHPDFTTIQLMSAVRTDYPIGTPRALDLLRSFRRKVARRSAVQKRLRWPVDRRTAARIRIAAIWKRHPEYTAHQVIRALGPVGHSVKVPWVQRLLRGCWKASARRSAKQLRNGRRRYIPR